MIGIEHCYTISQSVGLFSMVLRRHRLLFSTFLFFTLSLIKRILVP